MLKNLLKIGEVWADGPAFATPGSDPAVPRPGPYRQGGVGFDAEGLERAAQLTRELDSLRGAAGAVTQQRRGQELEKLKELQAKTEELKGYSRQADRVIAHKVQEQAAKMRQQVSEQDKIREDFKDGLKRQLDADMMQLKKVEREKQHQREEEMATRQEAIRRHTLEYEAELRQRTELETVRAKTEGRILAERKNHDLRLEQARQQARESRVTVLSGIKLAGETLGKGVGEFLTNREEMTAAVVTLSAVALGIYVAKTATGIGGRYIEARLGRPSLVRETSRRSAFDHLRHPIQAIHRMLISHRPADALEADGTRPKAIFFPGMEARLRRVAESAANTRANMAPFRHLLLHGPPGTGKTLFAKGLARHSGLDYAIMTGGDVAPLGREAVSEMHKLFDWAQTSRRGVLLFVDEADAFLRRRSTEVISEDMRNALNAFLYRTGEQTDRFMVVYASNQPEQFDDAINDRIDEMVRFDMPKEEERYRMLTFYMGKYLLQQEAGGGGVQGKAATILVDGVEDRHIRAAAKATEGFSGRELSKLAIAWQAAAYGSDPVVFNPCLMESVTEGFLEQKAMKESWDVDAMDAYLQSGDSTPPANGTPGFPLSLGGGGMPQMVAS